MLIKMTKTYINLTQINIDVDAFDFEGGPAERTRTDKGHKMHITMMLMIL